MSLQEVKSSSIHPQNHNTLQDHICTKAYKRKFNDMRVIMSTVKSSQMIEEINNLR